MAVELTEEEVEIIDRRMNDHMYHHTISNSVAGASCDPDCRMSSMRMFINTILREKQNNVVGLQCIHGRENSEHPGCFDSEGRPEYGE